MSSEEWYDTEIAPKLLALAKQCEERGMSFISAVEYRPGRRSRTCVLTDDAGLEMRMLYLCGVTAPNIDSYIIGLRRHCAELGIDTSRSIVLRSIET